MWHFALIQNKWCEEEKSWENRSPPTSLSTDTNCHDLPRRELWSERETLLFYESTSWVLTSWVYYYYLFYSEVASCLVCFLRDSLPVFVPFFLPLWLCAPSLMCSINPGLPCVSSPCAPRASSQVVCSLLFCSAPWGAPVFLTFTSAFAACIWIPLVPLIPATRPWVCELYCIS